MDFLAMTNQVRRRLREETLTSFGTGELTVVVKDLVNEAAREVLDSHEWSFMIREDGVAYFPGLHEATDGLTLGQYDTSGIANDADLLDSTFARKWTTPNRSRLVATSSTVVPDQSYAIKAIGRTPHLGLFDLEDRYFGSDITNGPFTVYTNEMALPADVKQVLSVRNEDEPVRLEEVEKYIQFDTVVPRPLDHTSSKPDVVYVGGTVKGTYSVQGYDLGLRSSGLMVWPVPSATVMLKYSYVSRPNTLSDETDELYFVPEEVEDLICWRAFEKALDSNIEDDPDRALRVRRNNEARTLRLLEADEVGRSRRRVLAPFRSAGWGPGPYSRWASTPVPSDST
jgi:hypothetical protein